MSTAVPRHRAPAPFPRPFSTVHMRPGEQSAGPPSHARMAYDGGSHNHIQSRWDSVERLLVSQLEAIRASNERLDQISQMLRASAWPISDTHTQAQLTIGDTRLETCCVTPGPLTVGSKQALQFGTGVESTLALDDVIDMRQFELDFDGLRPSQGGVPGPEPEGRSEPDGVDYETMSLSSEVDLVPPEYRSSRLPTPFDFPRAVTPDLPEANESPVAGTVGTEAEDGSRGLRARRKRPDYVHHPMDSAKRRKRGRGTPRKAVERRLVRSSSITTDTVSSLDHDQGHDGASDEDEENRSVRGMSTAIVPMLPVSDGVRRGRNWWIKGRNDQPGRLREIACTVCKGRTHWACAGLNARDDLGSDRWACPDCLDILQRDDGSQQQVEPVQQERCIRPDCVVRLPVKRKSGDPAHFPVESIIGRRVISARVSGKRRYEYLVRWEGYETHDATWQEARCFEDLKVLEHQFLRQCLLQGLNERARVVLLSEAEESWDENGDLKVDELFEKGVVPAEWWPERKGKYPIRIA